MPAPIIVPSEYSLGEFAPIPDRPEPTRREPMRETRRQICARLKWSDADFEAAIALSEPKFPPHGKSVRFGGLSVEFSWRDDQVDAFVAACRAKQAELQRFVR